MQKERESSFELLRIVAMFLVLVVHADYFSLGAPSQIECITNPIPSFFRITIESVSIVCVNVFVLISGWFGIHFKWKSLANFIFQVFFYGILIYLFVVVVLNVPISLKGVAACFQITTWNWFIKSYLLLYLISPVLNAFCSTTNHKTFLIVLLCFFVFQTVYGWSGAAKFIQRGYSTISFCGLYLLAQYARCFLVPVLNNKLRRKKVVGGCAFIYILCVLLMMFVEFFTIRFSLPSLDVFSYVSPLVIVASFSLLLICSQIKIRSKIVNWLASSCFAVFLIHTNINLCVPYFSSTVKHIYGMYFGLGCICLIFLFLLAVFTGSILIDQIRKFFWKFIDARFPT